MKPDQHKRKRMPGRISGNRPAGPELPERLRCKPDRRRESPRRRIGRNPDGARSGRDPQGDRNGFGLDGSLQGTGGSSLPAEPERGRIGACFGSAPRADGTRRKLRPGSPEGGEAPGFGPARNRRERIAAQVSVSTRRRRPRFAASGAGKAREASAFGALRKGQASARPLRTGTARASARTEPTGKAGVLRARRARPGRPGKGGLATRRSASAWDKWGLVATPAPIIFWAGPGLTPAAASPECGCRVGTGRRPDKCARWRAPSPRASRWRGSKAGRDRGRTGRDSAPYP
jgi:hypothetical protein